MKKLVLLVFAALLAMLGCGQAFKVKKNDVKYAGLPFYIKTGRCLHTSIFAAPYYRLTLQQSVGSQKAPPMTLNLSEKVFQSPEVQTQILDVLLKNDELTHEQYTKLIQQWHELAKPSTNIDPYTALCLGVAGCTDKLSLTLVANSATPVTYVNYGDTYTLNARAPFSGSVQADYKLAEDGTLSEVSAQMEDKTFETALSAIPISDLIKSAAGIATGLEAAVKTKLDLSIERRLLKQTRTKIEDFSVGCPTNGAIVTENFDSKIEDVSESSGEKDKSDDSNAISVTGTIKLPKPADTPKGDNAEAKGSSSAAPAKKDDTSSSAPTSTKKKKK